MCFSAVASFVAGGILFMMGVATLFFVHRPRDLPFAAVPLLFGIQQLIEGLLWQSLAADPAAPSHAAINAYAVIAFVLWPTWVPAAVLAQEPEGRRRTALLIILGIGALVSISWILALWVRPASAQVVGHSILYVVRNPVRGLHVLGYLVATCGSCLVSKRRWVQGFGVAALFSAGIAYPLYRETFASVWCFFAAILSAFIFVHFWSLTSGRRAEAAAGAR